ncbi:MAG: hypothetical protein WC531_00900 [Candidatus Paceibacterota bacterium]
MEAKLKHLGFIQDTINRMAKNSFLLKGWALTVIGGLLALSLKEMICQYLFISLAALIFFWLLDSYYLCQEKLFIRLYDKTRDLPGDQINFSMNTDSFKTKTGWLKCCFSRTISLFYGGLFLMHLIIILIS